VTAETPINEISKVYRRTVGTIKARLFKHGRIKKRFFSL